jgi:hypothetical protein
MAYKKDELIDLSMAAIEEHKCKFIDDLVAFLPCTPSTFYNHELEKMETIKAKLYKNKIKTKIKLMKNWEDEAAPASCQIALMKLVTSKDQRDILNGTEPVGKKDSDTGMKSEDLKSFMEFTTNAEPPRE